MLNENKIPLFLLSQSDIGAGKRGAANGPRAVKNELENKGIIIGEYEVIDNLSFNPEGTNHTYGKHIDDIIRSMNLLNDKVIHIISKNRFPFIISGDHSNAIGGLSGLKNAFPDKRIGVIWIDAHADLHSPYTTPSGNIHGMPLAALSGMDNLESQKNNISEEMAASWSQLKQLGSRHISPKFNLADLVLIGIRDVEEEEWGLIRNSGVCVFEPERIREKGIENVLSETLQHLNGCDLLYVSFDADSLDPSVSTGTGTTAPDGLSKDQAKTIIKTLMSQPKLGAFEVTEVNPSLDTTGESMASVIAELVHYGLTH